jgi:hypothetical protein
VTHGQRVQPYRPEAKEELGELEVKITKSGPGAQGSQGPQVIIQIPSNGREASGGKVE